MPGNSHPEHVSMSPSISFGNLYLQIERCPFCSTAIPSFTMLWNPIQTSAHDGSNQRSWAAYYCATCGGVVTACANLGTHIVLDYFPKSESISELIPQKPRHYLMEALNTVYSPSSSIMVCAS